MRKEKGFLLFRSGFIFTILLASSGIVAGLVYSMGILPPRYLSVILGVFAAVLVLMALLLFLTKNKMRGFAKILALVLSFVLLFGTKYLLEGGSFISLVTGANKDSHLISAIVLKDAPYKTMADVASFDFAANMQSDRRSIDKAVELIDDKFGYVPKITEYQTYDGMARDLYDGTAQVMLMSESQRTVMEELVSDFSEKTRVLDFVSYQVETSIPKADVNVKEDTFSLFITGIDTYGPVSTVSRSDVNMVMTVSPKTHQILLTSIPRDYHVVLGTIGAYDKLTHAGIYGVGESVATIEKLLDTKIDYYLKTNFNSVIDLVDALGGVDVYSKHTFVSAVGSYQFQSGTNRVDGEKALAFVRERKALPGGDNSRVRNQQELIKGIINKTLSPTMLTNFNSILASVGDSLEMSMSESDLKMFVKTQIDTGQSWEIKQHALEGTGSSSASTYSMPSGTSVYVMEPNMNTVYQAQELIRKMEQKEKI